jgi:hypothetical protein
MMEFFADSRTFSGVLGIYTYHIFYHTTGIFGGFLRVAHCLKVSCSTN